jgi:hypothetical protein
LPNELPLDILSIVLLSYSLIEVASIVNENHNHLVTVLVNEDSLEVLVERMHELKFYLDFFRTLDLNVEPSFEYESSGLLEGFAFLYVWSKLPIKEMVLILLSLHIIL